MRFVLLGTDPDLSPLLAWIARHPEHELAAHRRCARGVAWAVAETLSHGRGAGIVGATAGADRRPAARGMRCCLGRSLRADEQERALRRLARQGQPVITAHPALESLLAAYELEMFQRERQAYLAPWMPLRNHPLVAQFAAWIKDERLSPIGKIDRLTINRAGNRSLARRGPGRCGPRFGFDPRDRRRSQRRLGRGQRNCHERTKRTELRRARVAADARIAAAGALGDRTGQRQMANSAPNCNCTAAKAASSGACRRLAMMAFVSYYTHGKETTLSHDDWSYAAAAEQFLGAALAREPLSPSWNDAARSIELTDAVERSLKRGRKIEVRVEEVRRHRQLQRDHGQRRLRHLDVRPVPDGALHCRAR